MTASDRAPGDSGTLLALYALVPAAEHADLAEEAAAERARREQRVALAEVLRLDDSEPVSGAPEAPEASDGDVEDAPQWLTEPQLIAMLEHRLGATPIDGG